MLKEATLLKDKSKLMKNWASDEKNNAKKLKKLKWKIKKQSNKNYIVEKSYCKVKSMITTKIKRVNKTSSTNTWINWINWSEIKNASMGMNWFVIRDNKFVHH